MDAVAYQVLATAPRRGAIELPRKRARAAMIDPARENREPQIAPQPLSARALGLALDAGEPERSQSLFDELAAAYPAFDSVEVDVDSVSGFIAVAALGRGDELGAQLEGPPTTAHGSRHAGTSPKAAWTSRATRCMRTRRMPMRRWCDSWRQSGPAGDARAARGDRVLRGRRRKSYLARSSATVGSKRLTAQDAHRR